MPAISQLIDLARYPLHELDAPKTKALVARWTRDLQQTGACNLQGFLTAQGTRALAAESEALLGNAYEREWTVNFLFQSEADASLPSNHPAHRFWHTTSSHVANDQIDTGSKLRALYEWDALTEFVARVQGETRLHRYADEFKALNVIALGEGERTVWHHDTNECTVTLLLQEAEGGGEFVYGHDTRTEDGELDVDKIAKVIAEDPNTIHSLPRNAGTLTLFRGDCSLHGVTPVVGARKRITAILTYDPQPGQVGTDAENATIYGPRVQRILAERREKSDPRANL